MTKVLLAFDGSAGGVAAAEFLKVLKNATDKLLILFVIPADLKEPCTLNLYTGPRAYDTLKEVSEDLKNIAHAIYEDININLEFRSIKQVGNSIGEEILRIAKSEDMQLIVTGTRRLGTIQSIVLGSVSMYLVQRSPIPVLVVPL